MGYNKTMDLGFNKEELSVLRKLRTPQRIQDFLDTIPINFEIGGETCMSPRRAIRENKAHCMEGALLAAAALWLYCQPPLLLDLKTGRGDTDHVVALFKYKNYWGGITKTNHGVLRYRDPIYRDIRELAMSFFHEYFLDSGRKTLLSYSQPFDLRKVFKKYNWTVNEEDLWDLSVELDESPHSFIVPKGLKLRPASKTEIEAGKVVEWKNDFHNNRTSD